MCPNIYLATFKINVYMLFVYISFVIAASFMYKELTKIEYIKKRTLFLVIFIGFFVQYFGGAFFGYLYKWIYFHEVPSLQAYSTAGRYFHSVFLSILVYALLVCKWFRWPIKKMLDIYAIATLMMSGIERIGCFFQGCCSGKPTNLPWGMRFPDHPDIPVHPTQLYMLGAEMFICLVLIQINKEKKYDGQTFWVAVLLYSIYRLFIEFFRTNPVFLLGLTHAQAFSLLTLGLAWVVLARHQSAKKPV